jgi:hypothetical protein
VDVLVVVDDHHAPHGVAAVPCARYCLLFQEYQVVVIVLDII